MFGVVILNYNSDILVKELVQEISSYETIKKIVIVDNGSKKESLINLFSIKSDKVILITSKENLGYSGGNNLGIDWIKNNTDLDYVVIANPDVKFTEKYLEDMKLKFNANPDYALLTGIMRDYNGNISKEQYWDLPNFYVEVIKNFLVFNFFFKKRNKLLTGKNDKNEILNVVPAGSLITVNLKYFRDEPCFDDDFFLFYEENVLCKKIECKGAKYGLSTFSFYYHYHSITINTFLTFKKKMKIYFDSKLLYQIKYNNLSKIKKIVLKGTNILGYRLLLMRYRIKEK